MSNPILKEMMAFTLEHEREIANNERDLGRLRETFRYCHKRYPVGDNTVELSTEINEQKN